MTKITLLFILLLSTLSYSQETTKKFNLNFDAYSEGKDLPNEWFKWGSYILKVDSLRSDRQYVVKISSDEKGEDFGSVAYSIPANYEGDSITLSGYMKIEDVNNGTAGLLMRIDGKGERNVLAFDNMEANNINGTIDWKQYHIKLPFPAGSEKIYVGGILIGEGKAWFDDFVIKIDGEDIQTLEEIDKSKHTLDRKSTRKLKRIFKKNNTPVDFETVKGLDESLDALVNQIGDKKIVAIGEDTHGTSEYYRLRAALTKKLITEEGFNTVVLENPYDDIEILTRKWDDTNLDSLMRRHLFPIYQTEEMKSFLEWLKPQAQKGNVRFTGCDDSYWMLMGPMTEKIAALNDKQISEIFNSLQEAATLDREEFIESQSQLKEKPANETELKALVYEFAEELEVGLESKGLLDKEFEEQIFQLKTSYINYYKLKNKKPIITRDEMMAKRISFFANKPDAKVIVWAHNAHISNSTVIANEIGKMGEELKREFEENYHSIGMSSLNGSYSYIKNQFINDDHNYDDKLWQANLKNQPQSSWEDIFADVGLKNFYLKLNKLKEKTSFSNSVENLKLLGYIEEEESDYYQLSPFNMFDTLFFIRDSSATIPLFN